MAGVPHLDFPLRLDPKTGHLATVEQDSPDDLATCINVVLHTFLGERDELPRFGVAEMALSREPLDLELLAQQVIASEPRAAVLLERDPDLFEQLVDGIARLRVQSIGGADA
jgi:hypothetical protein